MITKTGIFTGNEFNEGYTNFTINGGLELTDGIGTNFSATKYLRTPIITCSATDSWEIDAVFKTEPEITKGFGGSLIPLTSVYTDDGGRKQFGIYRQSYNSGTLHNLILVFDGTNWIGNISYSYLSNTNYRVVMGQDSTKRYSMLYNLDAGTQSSGQVNLTNVSKAVTTYFNNAFSLGYPVVNNNTDLEYSINFNSFSFRVNGEIVWKPYLNRVTIYDDITANEFYEI